MNRNGGTAGIASGCPICDGAHTQAQHEWATGNLATDLPAPIVHVDGFQVTGVLPEPVTCMTVYKDRVFLASGQRVYELVDGVWHPMVFAT